MKKEIIEKKGISVIPQDRLDLIIIYYILKKKISNLITRIYWQDKVISQKKTIRLGRKPVDISLKPEDIRFNYDMKRLRVTGRVEEASPEEGVKGRKLGVDINIGDQIYLEDKPQVLEILELCEPRKYTQFIIFVIDLGGIALAKVTDTISILDEVYIPSSKFYDIHLDALHTTIKRIFKQIEEIKKNEKRLIVIAAVNTFTKKFIGKFKRFVDITIEGDFSGSYTGVIQALRDMKLRKIGVDNPVLNTIDAYESLFRSMYHKQVIYGLNNIKNAIFNRNIDTLYINYQVILKNPDLIEYIILCLKKKIKVVISDKGDFLGIALERFGGLVGIY